MKGFVPVSKENLLQMIGNAREALYQDYEGKVQDKAAKLVEAETKRSTTRKWYRLGIIPKQRFAFYRNAIIEWSGDRYYDRLDGCPFEFLAEDRDNSLKWLENMERVAISENTGEPISLTMKDFMRLDEPEKYHWCNVGLFYMLQRQ